MQLVSTSTIDVTDADLEDHPLIPPEKYLELLDRVQMNFLPTILTSLSIPVSVQKTIVEMGMCYTINSKIAIFNSLESVKNDLNYTKTKFILTSLFCKDIGQVV